MGQKKIIYIIIGIVVIVIIALIYLLYKPADKSLQSLVLGTGDKIAVGVLVDKEEDLARYQAIADYLNMRSDHVWHIVQMKDYGSFITAMQFNQIQAAFMGSAVAYQAVQENIALPVVRGEFNGVSDYYGYIFARKDSGINKIEDLQNKKFAYVDPYTSAGYFFPVYWLKIHGYDPDSFFKVASFLGSHNEAILAVLKGDYDGGAATDRAWNNLAKINPDIEKNLQILAKEGPFPFNTFMISVNFPQGEQKELRDILLPMDTTEEGKSVLKKFGADRFIVTETTDFINDKRIFDFLGKI